MFSDSQQKEFDASRWRSIPLKNANGVNYISRYIFFETLAFDGALKKLVDEYGVDVLNHRSVSDEGQIYVWLKAERDTRSLNGAELASQTMTALGMLNLDFCFSVEEVFPSYEDCEFKDEYVAQQE